MAALVDLALENSTSTGNVNILGEVWDIKDEIIANRRWFHENPELSFQEFQTAAKVAELLRSYGIEEVFETVGKVF